MNKLGGLAKTSEGDKMNFLDEKFIIENKKVLNDTALKIIDSFHRLILEEDYKRLTVSEICEAAQVSRKTFYKYFKDKNDIVEQILIKDILIPMNKLRELYINMDLPTGMILEWQYHQFYNERKFYKRISAFTGQNSFYEFILNHMSLIISDKLKPLHLPEVEHEYMTYFYASSHTMLLVKWIQDGMIIPPKQIASYYEKWTIPIFMNYENTAGNK